MREWQRLGVSVDPGRTHAEELGGLPDIDEFVFTDLTTVSGSGVDGQPCRQGCLKRAAAALVGCELGENDWDSLHRDLLCALRLSEHGGAINCTPSRGPPTRTSRGRFAAALGCRAPFVRARRLGAGV